jgi:hypothetical protein
MSTDTTNTDTTSADNIRTETPATAVTIFDDLLLPAAAVDEWFVRWRADYLPAATERGLQLTGAWRGFTEDPETVAVVIQWTLPTVGAFFGSRGRAGADRTVTDFWAATDRLAISRERRVLQDAGAPQ